MNILKEIFNKFRCDIFHKRYHTETFYPISEFKQGILIEYHNWKCEKCKTNWITIRRLK